MRYHINKNNEPAVCHAKSPESCPLRGNGERDDNGNLIGNGHYATLEDATYAAERRVEMKNRGMKTLSTSDPASSYREELQRRGLSERAREALPGDHVTFQREDGSLVTGEIKMGWHGPVVSFSEDGLETDLYTNADGIIYSDETDSSRFMLPVYHRSRSGEVLRLKDIKLESHPDLKKRDLRNEFFTANADNDPIDEVEARKTIHEKVEEDLRFKQDQDRNERIKEKLIDYLTRLSQKKISRANEYNRAYAKAKALNATHKMYFRLLKQEFKREGRPYEKPKYRTYEATMNAAREANHLGSAWFRSPIFGGEFDDGRE